jgi:hypothetical protein
MVIFYVTPCTSVDSYQSFGATSYLRYLTPQGPQILERSSQGRLDGQGM